MKFQTLVLVKHPLPLVWAAMRDELPLLAKHMDDIESIAVSARDETSDGVSIVNVWHAKPKLPDFIARHVDASKFTWTDYAEWHEAQKTCRWRIVPHAFANYFGSCGETKFEPAMGGKGTRITFSGDAEIKLSQAGDGVRKVFEDTLLKGALGFIQGGIEKNFRKIADALGKHLADPQKC